MKGRFVKKRYVVLALALALIALGAHEAYAYGSASHAEDKVFGILDRVLNMLADFLDRIFQSIADAVKSVFSGSGAEKETAKHASFVDEGKERARQVLDFYKR